MEMRSFGYDGYKITDDGQLWSDKSNKFLSPTYDKDGYVKYTISNKGKTKTFRAHQLVAIAFIPNPNNLPQVNHKDENPSNNNVDNLEWCNSKYNNNYGQHNKKMSQTKIEKGCTGKPVNMYDKDTNVLLNSFISASEAIRYIGKGSPANILKCCNHVPNHKTAYGYKWEFAEEIKAVGVRSLAGATPAHPIE